MRICLLFFLLLFSSYAFGQAEANWVFGNGCGLRFSDDKVHWFESKTFGDEGSSSISDENGRLLLYTNGAAVWNGAHQLLTNGEGLLGHQSAMQSVLVTHSPLHALHYVVFTIGDRTSNKGLRYSTIDPMKSKGRGEVLQKNVMIAPQAKEKFCVVEAEKNWVIVPIWNTSEIHAFEMNKSGVQPPVVSQSNIPFKNLDNTESRESMGAMVVSVNGQKIAITLPYRNKDNVAVYNFDANTGQLTLDYKMTMTGNPYGACFSPDGHFLYVTHLTGKTAITQINQWGTGAIPVAALHKSYSIGDIQLAINGRIYISRIGGYLDEISQPNANGKGCGLIKRKYTVPYGTTTYGLPHFPNHRVTKKIEQEKICDGTKMLTAETPNAKYLWNTGDTTFAIKVDLAGSYSVDITLKNGKHEHHNYYVKKRTPSIELTADTSVYCINEVVLRPKLTNVETIKWSNDDTTRVLTVKRSGRYILTGSLGHCEVKDTVHVHFETRPAHFDGLLSFSPSNSGFNEAFDFSLKNADTFKLVVKNKHGKTVYKSTDREERWKAKNKKGKPVAKGEYSWNVSYRDKCTGQTKNQKGIVKVY